MTALNRPKFPGLILAGGRSQRMGRNKALVPLGGEPLLGHVVHRLKPQVSHILLNAEAHWADVFGLPLVEDALPGHQGPLAGVLAGLRTIASGEPETTHLLTVPADSPFFPLDLADRLVEAVTGAHRTIAIATSGDAMHPVFALWPVALADDLADWLGNPDNRRIKAFFARHATTEIDFAMVETVHGPLDPFFNINTPADLARADTFMEARQK
jgi:molybdopterin-guanine dinucleotide biosynthesis protein A